MVDTALKNKLKLYKRLELTTDRSTQYIKEMLGLLRTCYKKRGFALTTDNSGTGEATLDEVSAMFESKLSVRQADDAISGLLGAIDAIAI